MSTMQSLGSRIGKRLSDLKWSQAKLAQKIRVSQPIISAYISGDRKPSRQTIAAIASELDISLEFLMNGEQGAGTAIALSTPASELNWNERLAPDDGTRNYGNARAELFRMDAEVLAAETGQNGNDASLGQEVAMEYRLGSLTGSHLTTFLTAIHWEVLRPHYESIASDDQHRTSHRFGRALRQLDETEKLWVMRIDDYGTSGLIGAEFEPSCFSGLVRYSEHSQKKSESSGGRFGLGSASLSAASGFDLLLFLSDLAEPVDGKTEGRLIGRAILPYHTLENGIAFEGPFFFGVRDSIYPNRRASAWSSPQIRKDLWMHRSSESGRTGTSILIVGYTDPEYNELDSRSAENAVKSLSDAFENKFWPAIARGRLSARFTRYENDRKVSERILDSEKITHPFIHLFSGDDAIVEQTVPLHVPSSEGEAPSDHSARLLVQLLPDDRPTPRVNEIALMRGPLMVVKYKHYPTLVLGAKPFRAALLCGESSPAPGQPANPADSAAELFLSKAEPPQHNDWTSRATDLTTYYYGGKKQLDNFLESLRFVLREVVAPQKQDDSVGPEALRKLLAIPADGRPQGQKAEIVGLAWLDAEYRALEAKIRLNFRKDRDRVALRPHLYISTDAGGGIDLPFDLEPGLGSGIIAENVFILDESARDASIILRPHWQAVPVRPDLSAIRVDMAVIDRPAAKV